MARTTDQIRQDLEGRIRASFPLLTPLEANTSQVSVWGWLKRAWSLLIHLHEVDLDAFRAEVEAFVLTNKPYTRGWYVRKAKEFQFGDVPRTDLLDVTYPEADPAKRLIAEVSVAEESQPNLDLLVKIAKRTTAGLGPLTPKELLAFNTYFLAVKPAGLRLLTVNKPAVPVRVRLIAELDPQLYDEAGRLLADAEQQPVFNAAKAFFTSMPFDSVFYTKALQDTLEVLPGVRDVRIERVEVEIKDEAGLSTWTLVARKYQPDSGYMALAADGASGSQFIYELS